MARWIEATVNVTSSEDTPKKKNDRGKKSQLQRTRAGQNQVVHEALHVSPSLNQVKFEIKKSIDDEGPALLLQRALVKHGSNPMTLSFQSKYDIVAESAIACQECLLERINGFDVSDVEFCVGEVDDRIVFFILRSYIITNLCDDCVYKLVREQNDFDRF